MVLPRIAGRFPRLFYFVLGCLVTGGSFLLYLYSYALAVALGIGDTRMDAWPAWLSLAREAVAYLPWIAATVALAVRVLLRIRVRLISFAAGLAAPYLALMALFYLGPIVADHWHRQPFDAAVWRASETETRQPYPTRLTMADDLVASKQLIGMTRAEIEALLGPPTPVGGFKGWDMVYYLGPERGLFRIDSEWLLVKFGPEGRAQQGVIGFD